MSSIREFKNVHRHRHMHTHTRERERQREREKEDILTDARNKKGTRHTLAITSLHPVSWAFMTDSQQRHSASSSHQDGPADALCGDVDVAPPVGEDVVAVFAHVPAVCGARLVLFGDGTAGVGLQPDAPWPPNGISYTGRRWTVRGASDWMGT